MSSASRKQPQIAGLEELPRFPDVSRCQAESRVIC